MNVIPNWFLASQEEGLAPLSQRRRQAALPDLLGAMTLDLAQVAREEFNHDPIVRLTLFSSRRR
jgi:hypothetical protein